MLKGVRVVKYLGVMLDEKVSWSDQVEFLSAKLARSAGIFSKLRYYLNYSTLLQMYHALFNSHLQYGILCWGSTSISNLNRLQILQNRAIRNMMKAPRYFRLDNYFLNLRVLKVLDLYKLEISKFMHSHHNNLLPDIFSSFFQISGANHTHFTRSTVNIMYDVDRCRTVRGQRSIRYLGPKVWNDIPISIKTVSKLAFKKEYKVFILAGY